MGRTKLIQDELDALKVDHARLGSMLKYEQEKPAQLLNNAAIFTEIDIRSDEVAANEKFRWLTAKKRLTEDATTIKSLNTQLRKADSHKEKIKRQAM